MKAQVTYQQQPLQQLKLEGLHLIEASAGTGKTWTLSSLMVRILSEKYMPRQVVATTFTRAAAAELKSRIRNRLTEMYHSAKVWQSQQATSPLELIQPTEPLAALMYQQFAHDVDYLVNRLNLVIDSLDELFVGTIDSFTQKLLREFAFDSGEISPRQISDDEQNYIYQILHDALRAWLQTQPQELVDLLLLSKKLKNTEDYIGRVKQTLSFSQAKLQQVACPVMDIAAIYATLEDLKQTSDDELDGLKGYFFKDGKYANVVGALAFNEERWHSLVALIAELRKQGVAAYFNPSVQSMRQDVMDIFLKKDGDWRDKLFKKCDESIPEQFYQLNVIRIVLQLVQQQVKLKAQLTQMDDYLHYYLSLELKKQLPQVLLQAGETTFTQQLGTLSDALHGERGQRLAQAIQQRYPVILVDEFQDTDQQQDNMLQAIWRDKQRLTQGCFIAVGDPKQAIYGFRGGDILTYLNAFNDIAAKQGCFYRLQNNFRSVPALVHAVDALFLRQTAFGEEIDYYPAQSGLSDDATLMIAGKRDTQPLRWMQLNEEQNPNEAYLIAQKIKYLLVQAQQGLLYIEKQGQHQPIIAEDIAVLAISHRELDLVQAELEDLQIHVNRSSKNSVFSSQAAQDVGALLQAMQQPERETVLKRALLTPAIGLTLSEFCQFEHDAEGMNQHVQNFRYARQLWLQKGFLIAWQWLAEKYHLWQNLAQHSGMQAERQIVNTRHLIEVLSQHSRHYAGVQHLIQWYQLQLGSPHQREWELERKLSSESGVQLMTIHKSKGLEFKIVFLMNANAEVKNKKDDLVFYQEQRADQEQPTRVIAISSRLIEKNDEAKQADMEKLHGENHRLWYVALTRASYQIYVSLRFQKAPTSGGVAFWLDAGNDAFTHPAAANEDVVSSAVEYRQVIEDIPTLYAVPYPKQQFYPKGRTSFSQLAAHLHYQQAMDALAELNVEMQAAEDEALALPLELQQIDSLEQLTQELGWVQRYFPQGAQGGNCLHAIFEQLDFQNNAAWSSEIDKQLARHGLWQPLLDTYLTHYPDTTLSQVALRQDLLTQLKAWIHEILHHPIALAGDLALKDIAAAHRLSEFPFYLALANQRLDSYVIHRLFLNYGLVMPAFETANTARYLNGAIDLIFFDGQRYHIADYKSNSLGTHIANYAVENIEQNMSMASYWLQASIYLLALHRYLSTHLQGYDIWQHLGGAHYLYLRGMAGQQGYGVKSWQPNLQLILDLDELLGSVAYQ